MGWSWLIPLLPFAAFPIVGLFGRRLPGGGSFLTILAVAAGFAISVFGLAELTTTSGLEFNQGPGPFEVEFLQAGKMSLPLSMIVDSLALVMLLVVTFLSALIQIYSVGYMRGDPRIHWYFAAMSLFTAAMLGLTITNNLVILYVAWELMGLCSYLLIGFWWERPSAREAAKKAFVTTRIGDVGLLIGILVLFINTGTFEMDEIFAQVNAGEVGSTTVTLSAILIFLGAMGKSGQFPLHVWLPDAMEGPSPVSALIHAATMVAAGVFLVARTYPLFVASETALMVVMVIGTITAIFAALIALVETDVKRVLAYSTISQLGYMMFALGAGGMTAAMLHLASHGFFKALLFLGAGAVMHACGGIIDIDRLGGLRRRMPVTTWTFIIGALSLSGFPLLSGFWSKDAVLNSAVEGGHWLTFAVGVITAALTAFYMFRVIFRVFFGSPRSSEAENAHAAEPLLAVPLAILAVFAVVAGWVGSPLIGDPFARFVYFGEEAHHAFESLGAILLSASAAIVGIVVAYSIYMLRSPSVETIRGAFPVAHRFLARRAFVDDLYQWLIDHVSLALAVLVALIDRRFVNDTVVDGSGFLVIFSGSRLRRLMTGFLYNYAAFMLLGVAILSIALITLSS